MHSNIRSLQKNFDSLCVFLQSLKFLPELLCLIESRIKDKSLINISIPGYSFVHVNCSNAASGVAVYITNNMKFGKCSTQYSLFNSESIWLKLSNIKNNNNFTLGVIYRQPTTTNVDKFLEDLSACLTDFSVSKKTFYQIGDTNIDLTSSKRAKLAIDCLNFILSNGTLSLITLHTRVSSNSAANLDHILTNNLKNKLTPLVFCKDLTDHFPIVCSVKKYKSFSTKINQPRFFGDKPKLNS